MSRFPLRLPLAAAPSTGAGACPARERVPPVLAPLQPRVLRRPQPLRAPRDAGTALPCGRRAPCCPSRARAGLRTPFTRLAGALHLFPVLPQSPAAPLRSPPRRRVPRPRRPALGALPRPGPRRDPRLLPPPAHTSPAGRSRRSYDGVSGAVGEGSAAAVPIESEGAGRPAGRPWRAWRSPRRLRAR